ncbi:hypothetical protein JCM17823_29000 [Halorubrum gandharaense]
MEIEIECRFFGPFREAVGEKEVTLSVGDERAEDAGDVVIADTYRELLSALESRYPALDGDLLDEEGADLAGRTVVTRNTVDLRHLDGLDTTVEDGDVVRLIPSVYGG